MERKQCFISHCSDDKKLIDELGRVFLNCYDSANYQFFNTSQEEFSARAGKGLNNQLRSALEESELMIAVVTDSYIRSHICITEFCSFWYMNKPIIPLVYSEQGKDFVIKMMGEEMIRIDLFSKNDNEKNNFGSESTQMVNAMKEYDFVPFVDKETRELFENVFNSFEQTKATREYIGSADVYKYINAFCNKSGIRRITEANLEDEYLLQRLDKSKNIYIVSTTGGNLISKLAADFFPSALAKGTNIYMFLPNRDSEFVKDVAEIEAPNDKEENEKRFARQFDEVVFNLKDSYKRSRIINDKGEGEVFLGCTYNLLRQTIMLAVYEDGSAWGWISVTMPPKRTIGDTVSLEFEGSIYDKSFAENVFSHVESVKNIAERRGTFIRLSENNNFKAWANTKMCESNDAGTDVLDRKTWDEAEAYWRDVYTKAVFNTSVKQGDAELIEVAAQHPLKSNGTPGVEFALRLDYAAHIYNEFKNQGKDVNIYVPGSVHCHEGKTDITSLSQAGVDYLVKKGVSREDLLGEEKNLLYKREDGVYNTADECYVASEIYRSGYYKRLHCVCSPNQLIRKKLFYLAFGVIPFYHTVSSENLAHNDIYELFHTIPNVLLFDHTWQSKDSMYGNRTREERMPKKGNC